MCEDVPSSAEMVACLRDMLLSWDHTSVRCPACPGRFGAGPDTAAASESQWLGPFRWPLLWIHCGGLDVQKCAGDSPFLRIQINVGVVIKLYTVDRCRRQFLQKSSQHSFSELRLLWQPSLILFAFSSSSLMLDLSQ